MRRRHLLQTLLAVAAAPLVTARAFAAAATKSADEFHKNWRSFLPEGFKAPSPTEKFTLSDAEWKKKLQPASYKVLREEDTERAGSSALNDEKRPGIFACAGCDLPLFTSEMKYESGTGWPSFFTTIPGVMGQKKDFKLIWPRTEYHCIRCGGHHGHLFDDGPAPTGQRWCNNGVALKFIPRGKA